MVRSATAFGMRGYRSSPTDELGHSDWAGRRLCGGLAVLAVWLASAFPAMANTTPTAASVSVLTTPSTAVAITLSATDADSDALTYKIAALPSSGTVSVGSTTLASSDLPYTIPDNGSEVTYTSGSTTHGAITFTYKANDGTVDSAAATVTVTVNAPPTATAATAIIPLNKDAKITLAGSDADSDTLSYTILSIPGHGVLALGKVVIAASNLPFALDAGKKEVTYTPDTNYHGADSFTFSVADTWATSDAATETIEVNTRPTVTSFTVYAPPGGTKVITLVGADADRDPISYVLLSLPAHGTLSDAGEEVTEDQLPYTLADYGSGVEYAPVTGYAGTDSFHYEVADGIESSTLGIVSIAINSPPVGADGAAIADSTGKASVVLAATDADGDTLAITFASLPTHGSISVGGNKIADTTKPYSLSGGGLSVAYQVDYDYSGTDAFTWQVTDGKDTAGPYQVSISIPTAVATPPPTTPDTTTDTTPTTQPSADDTSESTDLSNVDFDPCGAAGAAEAATLTILVTAGMLSTGIRRRHRNLHSR